MKCLTNKVSYISREIAEEALIENRSRNHFSGNNGPINVYECELCGNYHFTSKGAINEILNMPENRTRIKRGSEASYWEDKYRRKK